MSGARAQPRSASGGGRGPAVLVAWNLLFFAAWLVVPFVLAGALAWPAGLLHLGVVGAGAMAQRRHAARANPILWRRRRHIGPGTKGWDLGWNAPFWPLLASAAVISGLQFGRQGDSMGPTAWAAGLALIGAGFVLSGWAVGANPHYEGTVRIKAEVGHRVFEGGPYRRVRHPGYLGLALWASGTPLLLRSTWAIGPALATVAWIVLRTALEDALLRRELEGYREYAARTRWRLLPGVW